MRSKLTRINAICEMFCRQQNCREEIGEHTCDKRRPVSALKSEYPAFEFEAGMTEEDELWKHDVRETEDEATERAREVIERVFKEDEGNCKLLVFCL